MSEREKGPRAKAERPGREPPPFKPDHRLITYMEKPQGSKRPKGK